MAINGRLLNVWVLDLMFNQESEFRCQSRHGWRIILVQLVHSIGIIESESPSLLSQKGLIFVKNHRKVCEKFD